MGLPIIGNWHQFHSSELHVFLWKLSKKYGSLMRMKLGSREVVISSAKMAKEALKTHDLALKRVKQFQPIREDEVSRMINRVSKLASSYQQINLMEMVMSLTSNIICRSAFGLRYEEEGQENRRFYEMLNEAQEVMVGGYLVADFLPSFGWIDKFTGKAALLEKVFKEFDCFYQELIDKHLQPNRRPKSMDGDIIDILLGLMEENSSSGNNNLTLDHIKAVLMNVFVAGTDTSAVVIVWAMTALMKDPRVMNIVQQEIRGFIGEKGRVDEDDIKQLPYFRAVVKETLRMYPPAPLLVNRETLSKCTIDEYEIKPKVLVFVNAWAIARDPEYWENPDEFYPERFLDSNVDYKGHDFEFIPFGAGRRICLGMIAGVASAELALANLLYAFDWELPSWMKKEDIDTESLPGLAMHKKTPLCLFAKKV
nr:cytochrome P450 83B1-like [Ipomoea batatas]